jgi:hypothetical protein
MSLSPPFLCPLVLISSWEKGGFVGTGTAHHPDEWDLQFKILLILTYDVNMNDRSWIDDM